MAAQLLITPFAGSAIAKGIFARSRSNTCMPLVVILDDVATNRKVFAELAASIESGVSVRSFGDPAETLAWLEHNTPDLIVPDFKMPVMDGAEFIRRFRTPPRARTPGLRAHSRRGTARFKRTARPGRRYRSGDDQRHRQRWTHPIHQ